MCVSPKEGRKPPLFDIVHCSNTDQNGISWPLFKSGMNWVFPSATGSLGVEFDGMCWLSGIHVEIMASGFEKLPRPAFQIIILWLPSEVLYSGMQIDWKPWPVELQHQCNSVMHHVPPFPKLDENLSHDESQGI
jgi:hypothetical protein